MVAVTTPSLCEFVWVLTSGYKQSRRSVAAAIRHLLAAENVTADRLAAEFGLAFLDAGSDFADGVIAYEGRRMGGEVFVSFDKAARRTAESNGVVTAAP